MSQIQEFEKAMQAAWSTLTAMRRMWTGVGAICLSLILIYPLVSWLFKFETNISGWVIILIIAIAGKFFAHYQIKLAEERYFSEFPALIPEDE